jgi:NADH-quinone oxidoreductase subunit C
MLRLSHSLQLPTFYTKGLTRGWYHNRLNWGGRYFAKTLANLIPKIIYGFLIKPYKLLLFSSPSHLPLVVSFLKESSLFKFQALTDIVAADHPHSIDGRFTLNYCFWSYSYSIRFIIRLFVNSFQPLLSLNSFYPSAAWLEREVWDFYGIKFLLHPDLRRILTDYGFTGHPLRKDFPLVGFIELRYDDSFRSIVFEPVELSQDFRFFKFSNPWVAYK